MTSRTRHKRFNGRKSSALLAAALAGLLTFGACASEPTPVSKESRSVGSIQEPANTETAATAEPPSPPTHPPSATPVLTSTSTQAVALSTKSIEEPSTAGSIRDMHEIASLERDAARTVALNSNRNSLAAGGSSGVWLYDYPTLQPQRLLPSEAPWISTVAWSPDDQIVAGAGFMIEQPSDKVWLWDAATGNVLHIFEDSPNLTSSLAWSPDGTKLAVAGFQLAQVWDVTSGDTSETFYGEVPFTKVAWSPDGTKLAATDGIGGNIVHVWNMEGKEELARLEIPSVGIKLGANSLAWSLDGSRLAAGGLEKLMIWDTATWESLPELPAGQTSYALTWSPDSAQLAWGDFNGRIGVLTFADGEVVAQNVGRQRGTITNLDWSADGAQLISGSFGDAGKADQTIMAWEISAN